MSYSSEFVLKVNEVYHDVEGSDYQDKHPEVFKDEIDRWQKIGQKFLIGYFNQIRILDIGSGTGFVPLQICSFLKKEDTFVCSDISQNILDVCQKNVLENNFPCQTIFKKFDGKSFLLDSNQFDFITLNSVLHHIPDFQPFLKEVNRLLKIDGRLIICHEPNKSFFCHRFLWPNYKLFSYLISPKQLLFSVLKRMGLPGLLKNKSNIGVENQARINQEVNRRLLEMGFIKSPLTHNQIIEIIDIQSPTAGGFHKERGIDILSLVKDYLPNFKVEDFKTYNHLRTLSSRNFLTKWYDQMLAKIYPHAGSSFSVFIRKVF